MFRHSTITAIVMALAWSSAAVAATGNPMPPGVAPTAAKSPPHPLDTDRYLQNELDWRSYYLNRSGVPRDGARSDINAAPQSLLRNDG